MTDIQFRGRIRRKGYNPVQVPDQSQKILNEADRTLRGMQQVQQADLENRQAYLNALKDNQRKEEIVRDKNFNLQTEFAKAYRDAELQHYQTRINDVKTKELENQQWQELRDLIPKAIQSIGTIANQRDEHLRAVGTEIATRWGLTPEELNFFKHAGQNIDWADAGMNRVKMRLEAAGAPPEVLEKVMNLSGRKLLGAMEYSVSNYGKNSYPTYINEKRNQVIPGLNKSLADMEADEGGIHASEYRVGLRYHEGQFLAAFKKGENAYDDAFLAKHLRPWMDKKHDELMASQHVRDKAAYKSIDQKRKVDNLGAKIFGDGAANPGGGLLEWWNSESGGLASERGRVRRESFNLLAAMATSGELSQEQWNQIRNTEVKVGDKLTTIGKQWSDETSVVNAAFTQRFKAENEAHNARTKNFDVKMQQGVFQSHREMGRRLNPTEIAALKEDYSNNNIKPGTWLTDYENQNVLEREVGQALITQRNIEGTLTMAHLYSGVYPPELMTKENEKLTIDHPGSVKSTNYVSSVKQAIAASINKVLPDADKRSSQVEIMSGRAENRLRENVRDAIIGGKYNSVQEAWEQEAKNLSNEIKAQEGEWAVKTVGGQPVYGPDGGFLHLEKAQQWDVAGAEYAKKALVDRNWISIQGSVKPEHLEELDKWEVGPKEIPSWVFKLDSIYLNKDPYEIMNTILRANGSKTVIEPPGGARAVNYVHPAVKKLLTNKPSLAKTSRGMAITTSMMNKESNSFEPMLDLIKPKETVNADEANNGFDAMNYSGKAGMTTGTDTFGKPITEMPISEVMNLQDRGSINGVGAYQFTPQDINHFVRSGQLSPDEIFDESVQKRLAITKIWEDAGIFMTTGTNEQVAIDGLGQQWPTLKGPDLKMSQEEWVDIRDSIDETKALLVKSGFNVFQMRDEIDEELLRTTVKNKKST